MKRVLVYLKRSAYQLQVEEAHDARVEELLAREDRTVGRMMLGHHEHEDTVEEVRTVCSQLSASVTFDDTLRYDGPLDWFDLVVTVGGDGTLLAASHQVGPCTPLLGINSAPGHSVGFFCAATRDDLREALSGALEGTLRRTSLSRMQVEINGVCVHKRVLNEALVCHASPAATSRYFLSLVRANGAVEEEEQKSSGIWIGPAAGSTAAQRSAGGRVLPIESKKLQYVVREPYTPVGHSLRLTLGLIEPGGHLAMSSKMRTSKVFLDGEVGSFDLHLGDVVTMRRSDEPLMVLGLTRNGG